MAEKNIQAFINEFLTDKAQENAAEFVAYLQANEMLFERCRGGYWADKLYWLIKYKTEYVCFILVNGYEAGDWVIWFEGGNADWFSDSLLEAHMKEIAWQNADFCGNCGYCDGGKHNDIFGKEFDNVCRTPLSFTNPNNEELGCMKKLVEIRKTNIIRND